MRDEIGSALKTAQKARDADRVSTLRMVNAAIQDRDIANRGTGKQPADAAEVLQILAKMVKQREESAKAFRDGGRPELAEKEDGEIAIIREFMPKEMDAEAMASAVRDAITSTGAASIRDMGKVMAELRAKHAGAMDFGKASPLVKAMLQPG